ncbi:MAG: anti-sigma factor domain-containing protein [Phycisphaerales bacterium JB060]
MSDKRAQRETAFERPTEDESMEALVHASMAGDERMPDPLVALIEAQGKTAMLDRNTEQANEPIRMPSRRTPLALLGVAAVLMVGAGIGLAVLTVHLEGKNSRISELETQLAEATKQAEQNQRFLASVRQQLEQRTGELDEAQQALAAADEERLQLAERLATVTGDLEEAELRIARYEEPVDPATLAANRQKLLEVPGTVRLAWSPFDLPDAPAVQQDVTGDVVWNDELEQGYLRFVGLDVNDPDVEQYQVWVIDDRGMEQKVSGGVFNATAQGEVIVPIDPALDLGRVALFAVTVEEPGGIMVPDLRRRVVVAPRDEG